MTSLSIGDMAVHPTGVVKVVEQKIVYGDTVFKLRLINPTKLNSDVAIYVPEKKVQDVLRSIVDISTANVIINSIQHHEERERKTKTWKAVNTLIREMMSDSSIDKMVDAFLAYYRKRRTIFEDQFFAQVSQRLLTELACAIGKDVESFSRSLQKHIQRYSA
jgi:RNA polymerase-interacting CarD/CdnL/TRCF family regulator